MANRKRFASAVVVAAGLLLPIGRSPARASAQSGAQAAADAPAVVVTSPSPDAGAAVPPPAAVVPSPGPATQTPPPPAAASGSTSPSQPQSYPPPPASSYPPPPGSAPAGYAPPGYPPPPAGYPPGSPGNGYPPPPYGRPYGYPPTAYAQTPPPNVHDGFYLRLQAGPQYLGVHRKGGVTGDADLSGTAAGFGIALGGVLLPNLAVYGTLFFGFADDPHTGGALGGGTAAGTTSMLAAYGAGVAYYVEPANVYVSATIAGVDYQLYESSHSDNVLFETDTGLGFAGAIGKEWWVSENWGLGAAAQITAATSMKDKHDASATWRATAFALMFSATYN